MRVLEAGSIITNRLRLKNPFTLPIPSVGS